MPCGLPPSGRRADLGGRVRCDGGGEDRGEDTPRAQAVAVLAPRCGLRPEVCAEPRWPPGWPPLAPGGSVQQRFAQHTVPGGAGAAGEGGQNPAEGGAVPRMSPRARHSRSVRGQPWAG